MTRLMLVALLFPSLCLAGRPPEAIDTEQRAASAEVRDLERRARALDEQSAERKERLKRRLRALYKLSSGGYLRLLSGSDSAAEMATRHEAVRRVLSRDLDELSAVREESRALDSDHARSADAVARVLELDRQVTQSGSEPPTGLAARRGRLLRPVPGSVVSSFGGYRRPAFLTPEANSCRGKRPGSEIELIRRGVEMRAQKGELVRTVAAGQVRWVGDVPGLGRGVAVDHGDGYLTLVARLRVVKVLPEQPVTDGAVLGEAAGPTVYVELAQGGTPINPLGWLSPPLK